MTDEKKVVLRPNKLPEITGQWTIGEILQAARQLAAWVENLSLQPTEHPAEVERLPDEERPSETVT